MPRARDPTTVKAITNATKRLPKWPHFPVVPAAKPTDFGPAVVYPLVSPNQQGTLARLLTVPALTLPAVNL